MRLAVEREASEKHAYYLIASEVEGAMADSALARLELNDQLDGVMRG